MEAARRACAVSAECGRRVRAARAVGAAHAQWEEAALRRMRSGRAAGAMAGGSALRAALGGLLLMAVGARGLYFHIGETEKRCFIEEIPDETMVIGAGRRRWERRGMGGGGGAEGTEGPEGGRGGGAVGGGLGIDGGEK